MHGMSENVRGPSSQTDCEYTNNLLINYYFPNKKGDRTRAGTVGNFPRGKRGAGAG